MGVYEGRGQLAKAVKQLMYNWAQTRSSWNDAMSHSFEETYLQPLEQDLRTAMGAMDHMSKLLIQLRRDCE